MMKCQMIKTLHDCVFSNNYFLCLVKDNNQ